MLLNVQGWFLFTLISCVVCQIVPKIPCPEFFEYVFVKDHFQGKLTFPKPSSTGIEVEVELSQEGPLENGYSGYIALNKTEVDILNGDPVIYQITFPSSNEVPKLNSIRVNNKTICSGLEFYSFDKQKLKLLHKTILNSPVPSNKNDFSDITSDHRKKPKDLETTQIPQEKLKRLLESTEIQQEKQKGLLSFLDFLPIIGVSKFIPRIRSSIRTAIEERGKEVAIMAEFSTKDHCGYQHTELTPFVNGGRPIDRAQMPWIAAIYQKADTGLEFLCSGSLLSSLTVITAAHCVANRFKFSADRLVVYLGKHNLSDYSEQGFEAREVKTYLVHPEYKVRNLSDADIALLIFHDRINFSDYITPICLWNSAFTLAKSKENRVGFIAGWGANEDGQTLSNIPKMVEAKIYSSEECSAFPGYKQVSTPRTLCAGNMDGTGPCIGDSGAGLIIKDDGRWFIRAVVSGGLKTEKVCGRQQFVVYCDLAKHTKWILRNLIE